MEVRPGKWNWETVNKKGQRAARVDNHLWDCEVMGVVLASLRGVLSAGLDDESIDQETE